MVLLTMSNLSKRSCMPNQQFPYQILPVGVFCPRRRLLGVVQYIFSYLIVFIIGITPFRKCHPSEIRQDRFLSCCSLQTKKRTKLILCQKLEYIFIIKKCFEKIEIPSLLMNLSFSHHGRLKKKELK